MRTRENTSCIEEYKAAHCYFGVAFECENHTLLNRTVPINQRNSCFILTNIRYQTQQKLSLTHTHTLRGGLLFLFLSILLISVGTLLSVGLRVN